MDHRIVPKLSITITQIKQLKVKTKWTRKRQLIRVMIAGSVRRSDLGDGRPRPRLARPARGAGGAAGGADGHPAARGARREPRSPARCPQMEGTNSRTQERHSSTLNERNRHNTHTCIARTGSQLVPRAGRGRRNGTGQNAPTP